MMRSFILVVLVLMSLPAMANRMGAGFSFGNPTGLNAKYWLDNSTAVDAGMGFSFGKNTDFSIHSDYLLHQESALYLNDVIPLDLYYGIGGRMEFADDIEIGVRVPIGVAHMLENKSADIFGEIAPIADIITKTGIEIHLLFGARYYF